MIAAHGTSTLVLLDRKALAGRWRARISEFRDWLRALRSGDPVTRRLVAEAIDHLLDDGPALGRPLADRITGSRLHNLKELRPGSSGASEVRILFILRPGAQCGATGSWR